MADTAEILAEILRRELGSERVLAPDRPAGAAGDAGRLAAYGRDESGVPPHTPDCAVLCASREQVEIVLRLALEHRVPVTPRGA
ncbi:MAG TPA: hypothetical protein VNM90_00215, partial [Haliangium sp.]|nr:hypothetical protein [Haliangium sp.]